MFGEKQRKRVYINSSEEEEIELLDETFLSSEEENLIRQKTKRVLRLLSSDSESEIEQQEVLQSQRIYTGSSVYGHLLVAAKFKSKNT